MSKSKDKIKKVVIKSKYKVGQVLYYADVKERLIPFVVIKVKKTYNFSGTIGKDDRTQTESPVIYLAHCDFDCSKLKYFVQGHENEQKWFSDYKQACKHQVDQEVSVAEKAVEKAKRHSVRVMETIVNNPNSVTPLVK